MAFALLFSGLIMIIAAVRNKQDQLVCLVKNDFTGSGNFLYWVVALIVIGAIGYVDKIKPFSDALLVLIILAVFLASGTTGTGGGFFKQFTAAINSLGGGGGDVTQLGRNLFSGIRPL